MREINRVLFTLPLFFLVLLTLPLGTVNGLRSAAVSSLNAVFKVGKRSDPDAIERQNLQLENTQLRKQLDLVYEWLNSEKRLQDQLEFFRAVSADLATSFAKRRLNEITALLHAQSLGAFARIVYRDPSSWSSTCWIDVGSESNESLGKTIVSKNSPVVCGNALVGVIDYVGKNQSRVRFITDSGLKTAVRAVRGAIIDRDVAFAIEGLLSRLLRHPKMSHSPVVAELSALKKELPFRCEDEYFSKGEIIGSSKLSQRSLSGQLKGVGFNCDFGDEEGPARELHSNAVIKNGDVLVTSGLDGVFPAGLIVGYVKEIAPLKIGAFHYELDADPAVGDMGALTSVFVLPPQTSE